MVHQQSNYHASELGGLRVEITDPPLVRNVYSPILESKKRRSCCDSATYASIELHCVGTAEAVLMDSVESDLAMEVSCKPAAEDSFYDSPDL